MVEIVGLNTNSAQPTRLSDRPGTKASGARKEGIVTGTTGDRLDISAGKETQEAVRRLVQVAQTEPDVRPEEVLRARNRLENGEYNGIEVSRQAARKILGLD